MSADISGRILDCFGWRLAKTTKDAVPSLRGEAVAIQKRSRQYHCGATVDNMDCHFVRKDDDG